MLNKQYIVFACGRHRFIHSTHQTQSEQQPWALACSALWPWSSRTAKATLYVSGGAASASPSGWDVTATPDWPQRVGSGLGQEANRACQGIPEN